MIPLRLTMPVSVMNPTQCATDRLVAASQTSGQRHQGVHRLRIDGNRLLKTDNRFRHLIPGSERSALQEIEAGRKSRGPSARDVQASERLVRQISA